jgi:hypothetical protein
VRVVSGGYNVVGATDVSAKRKGGKLEEAVKQTEGDMWNNSFCGPRMVHPICYTAQLFEQPNTLSYTFQAFSFFLPILNQ